MTRAEQRRIKALARKVIAARPKGPRAEWRALRKVLAELRQ